MWYDYIDIELKEYTKEEALSYIRIFDGVNYITLGSSGHITLWESKPIYSETGWVNLDYETIRQKIHNVKYWSNKIAPKDSLFSSSALKKKRE